MVPVPLPESSQDTSPSVDRTWFIARRSSSDDLASAIEEMKKASESAEVQQ